MPLPDETSITELSIAPDGRIFVFGLSRQVLQLLKDLDFTAPIYSSVWSASNPPHSRTNPAYLLRNRYYE